jgi:hypothetical protein
VLDAVAGEDLGPAVVHADGDADDDGPLGLAETFQHAAVHLDGLGHQVELVAGHPEGRRQLEDGVRGAVVFVIGKGHVGCHWRSPEGVGEACGRRHGPHGRF